MLKQQVVYFCLHLLLLSVLLSFLSVVSGTENNEKTVVIDDTQSTLSVAPFLSILEDPSRQLSLSDVVSERHQKEFQISADNKLNFGITSSAYWVRFHLKNTSNQQAWYLLLDTPLYADLDLYVFPEGTNKSLINDDETRLNTEKFAKRLKHYRRPVWSLSFQESQEIEVYIRATNGHDVLSLPVELLTSDQLLKNSNADYKTYTGLYAAILVMGLYAFIAFFTFRESSYISLSMSILTAFLMVHAGNPVFESLSFLNNSESHFYHFDVLLLYTFVTQFIRQILSTKERLPRLDHWMRASIALYLIAMLMVGFLSSGILIMAALAIPVMILCTIAIIQEVKCGNRIAKYLLFNTLFIVAMDLPYVIIRAFFEEYWTIQQEVVLSYASLVSLFALTLIQNEKTRLLRENMLRADVSSQAKGEFLSSMSHELRTPMNSILGLSTLLKLENLNTKQKEYVENLEISSRHMLSLIGNVLDMAKIESKKFELANNTFRLASLLQEVHTLLEKQAQQKGLTLDFHIEQAIPETLQGDKTRLVQVLINLISNGIKYTEHGKVSLNVHYLESGVAQQRRLQFDINDTGIGISQEMRKDIFTPFSEENKGSIHHHDSFGLGLTISYQLIEMMGGELQLESTKGEGAHFFFTLNFVINSESDDSEIAHRDNQDKILTLPKGVRILLVDDNEMNRFVGREIIQSMQGKVTLAPNGKSALLQLEKHIYDIVLLDIDMPDMDGFEVTHWIRQHSHNPNIIIVALTAHAVQSVEQQCKQAGMNDFLSKPIERKDLHAMIHRWY